MSQSLNKILISLSVAVIIAVSVYMMSGQTAISVAAAVIGCVAMYIGLTAEFKRQQQREREQARINERKRLERSLKRAHGLAPSTIQAQLEKLYEQLQPLQRMIQNHPKLHPVRDIIFSYLPKRLEGYARENLESQEHQEALAADLVKVNDTLYGLAQEIEERKEKRRSQERSKAMKKLERFESPNVAQRTLIMREVERNLQNISKRAQTLPDSVKHKVQSISDEVTQLLPSLLEEDFSGQHTFNVRQIANDYLPDTLERYSLLPADFAATKTLDNGKTAQQTIMEQLALLEESLRKLRNSVHENDAEGLLIHGRFLEEKFAGHRLDLG